MDEEIKGLMEDWHVKLASMCKVKN